TEVETDDRDALYTRLQAIQDNLLFQRSSGLVDVALTTTLTDAAKENTSELPVGEASWDHISAADFSQRSSLHERIGQLGDKIVELQDAGKSMHLVFTSTLAEHAQDNTSQGLAYRYALVHLNPFAISGDAALYSQHNQNEELDYYDSETDEGTLTDQYLKDRAEFLRWKNFYAIQDADGPGTANTPDQIYMDVTRDLEIGTFDKTSTVDGVLLFGTKDADTALTTKATDNKDHIYGMDGNDIIIGKGGDDYLEGGAGIDTIFGDDGEDELHGGAGDDGGNNGGLFGGDKDDLIYGNSGDDTIEGGADHDLLVGGVGQDNLIGGSEHDWLMGGIGYSDPENNRFLILDDGVPDRLEGGVGDDIYWAGTGDIISDSDGIGIVRMGVTKGDGTNGHVYLGLVGMESTENPNVYTEYHELSDVTLKYTYNEGSNTLIVNQIGSTDAPLTIENFTDGELTIKLGAGPFSDHWHDSYWFNVTGKAPEDWAGSFNPWWVDYLTKDDTTTVGSDTDDDITGTDEDETIDGGAGDDIIDGNAGNDSVYGSIGNDQLSGGVGNDLLDGGAGDDSLSGGDGSDTLFGGDDNDQLDGDAGDDMLAGEAGDDTLNGGGGDDLLYSGEGNDTLSGGDGSDELFGGAGDDQLRGDSGPGDILNGGVGSDTYLFALGDGDTTINNDDSSSGRHDVLRFLSGIVVSDISISNSDNDLIINIQSSGETITVTNYLLGSGAGGFALNAIEFADGTNWDIAAIVAQTLLSSDGADTIFGYSGDDVISGGSGNDILSGLEGNDTLNGGNDDDYLYGGVGDDLINGDAGDDRLMGDVGNDRLLGGNGDDDLWGYDGDGQLTGGAGDDELSGGAGNDYISGGTGVDTLRGGSGDDILVSGGGSCVGGAGNDTYIHIAGNGDLVISNDDYNLASNDVLIVQGIDHASVHLSRGTQDELEMWYLVNSVYEIITIIGFFDQNATTGQALDSITFSDDGTTWDIDYIKTALVPASVTLYADPAGGELHGMSGDDYLYGAGGNDLLYGYDGNDYLDGGAGIDGLFGEAGDDYLSGGDGNDNLHGEAGDDDLMGGSGTDVVFGGDGDDRLRGGSGDGDHLEGGSGSDVYLYVTGDGDVTIRNSDSSQGRYDVLQFHEGIEPSDVSITRSDDDLLLRLISNSGIVTVKGYFSSDIEKLDAIEFVDGTVWDIQYIVDIVLQGTEGDDLLYALRTGSLLDGLGGNDTLIGAQGDDVLIGNSGNDYLFGGKGNDDLIGGDGEDTLYGEDGDDILHSSSGTNTLNGGSGNNTYILELVVGSSTIQSTQPFGTSGNHDSIVFDQGVSPDMVSMLRMNNDLILQYAGSIITIEHHFSRYHVSSIEFHDGTIWSSDDINAMLLQSTDSNDEIVGYETNDVIDGGAGNDALYGASGDDQLFGGMGDDTLHGDEGADILAGGAGNDVLQGGDGADILASDAGNDVLYGDGGSDVLTGGVGDDQLDGGLGDDIYHFSRGDGQDIISDVRGNNRIEYSDIASTEIIVRRSGDDLVLFNRNNDDQVAVTGQFDDDESIFDNSIKEITFSDGITWNVTDLLSQATKGTALNDAISGFNFAETIEAEEGNDDVNVFAGNDIVDGGPGDDYLLGGAGSDLLKGGADNDFLFGQDGSDHIEGGSGDDFLFGYRSLPSHYMFHDSVTGPRQQVAYTNYSWDTWKQPIWFASRPVYDVLHGGEGSDVIIGVGELYGGKGGDRISGSGILYGEEGDDYIITDPVNYWTYDHPGGGYKTYHSEIDGNNTIVGGLGNDTLSGGNRTTYIFEEGDGQDTIINEDTHIRDSRVAFGDNISTSNTHFERLGDDLIVSYGGQGDQITISKWFSELLNDYYGISSYQGKIDRFEFSDGSVITMEEAEAGLAPDSGGSEGGETPPPSDEDKILVGPTLTGGSGNDTLWGGGGGYSQLEGGEGGDVYLYGIDDGNYFILNRDSYGGHDVLRFLEGIAPADVAVTRDRTNLQLMVDGSIITVVSYFQNDGENNYALHAIEFADGTSWIYEDVNSFSSIGTTGSDSLYGGKNNDVLDGLADKDTLFGAGGDDDLAGGDGTDNLYGQEGADILNGGSGNDIMHGGTGNDVLNGGAGSDTLFGGLGSDTSTGGAGNDSYYYAVGDGIDVIDNSGGGADTIYFTDITSAQLLFSRDGDDLLILVDGDPSQSVRVLNHFLGEEFYIDLVQPSDSPAITETEIYDLLVPLNPVNNAPVLDNPLADQAATEDSLFSFKVPGDTFSDINVGDTLTLSATLKDSSPLPAWLSFDPNTGTFSGTPDNADGGLIYIKVTATDGIDDVSDVFALGISNVNDAPLLDNPLADQSVTEDRMFNFQVPGDTFSDVDTWDTLTLSATMVDGSPLPGWLSFDPDTGIFNGTPDNADVGEIQIKVTATDSDGAAVSDIFSVAVGNVDDAPVLDNPLADQAATEDSSFSFQVPGDTFSDDGAISLTATLDDGSPLPGWLSFDPAMSEFSGIPDNDAVGELQIKVTASDGTADTSDVFSLIIGNVNDAPVLDNPLADQTATEDNSFSFQVPNDSFSDIDPGDTLSLPATLEDGTPLPGWLSFDPATGEFSGTPDNAAVGEIQIKVTATDSGGVAVSDIFSVAVGNVNDAPVLDNPLADQTATEDSSFIFQIPGDTFSDLDVGDTLSLTATLEDGTPLPGWLSFDPDTGTFSGTPDNADVGDVQIKVAATDSDGAAVSDIFSVAVGNVNDAPVLDNPLADQTATEDSSFIFQIPGDTFSDLDVGDTLSLTATLEDGSPLPGWLDFDPATGEFSGTPDNAAVGELQIKVTASDGTADMFDVFSLNIANINNAPVLDNPLADQSATEDNSFSFQVPNDTFSDIDAGDTLSLTATLEDGTPLPGWLSFNPATGELSGTPDNADVGELQIKVTATDSDGASASDIFSMTVANVNNAPVLDNPLADQTATEDSSFSFQVPGDTFSDDGAISLSATLDDGSPLPSWLSFDPATGAFSGTPDSGQIGELDIKVTAIDSGGLETSDIFVLNVQEEQEQGVTIIGGGGNDTILGSSGADIIIGGTGNDTLNGGAGDDTFVVEGMDQGSDRIIGGDGFDTIQGGAGDDSISLNKLLASYSLDRIDGGLGNNTITGTSGGDTLDLSATELLNIAAIDGGAGNDTITGSDGNDIIIGGTGNDTLNGGAGDDTFVVDGMDQGSDRIIGGDGFDTIQGGA
ncbi:MAG: hypothetical protein GY934_06545, partial [Gammaproteobacteria bacterium]|nr:hypothetical protein [Gammaproteobacteria bacterium]